MLHQCITGLWCKCYGLSEKLIARETYENILFFWSRKGEKFESVSNYTGEGKGLKKERGVTPNFQNQKLGITP